MKPEVPYGILFRPDDVQRKLFHGHPDTQGHITAGCVSMLKMAIFMRQHCAEIVLFEAVQDPHANDKYPFGLVIHSRPQSAALVNRNLGTRGYANLRYRPSTNSFRNFFSQSP